MEATVTPVMSPAERIGFEISTALDKDLPVARGWAAGNLPSVKAKIAEYNAREMQRVEAAALALLS